MITNYKEPINNDKIRNCNLIILIRSFLSCLQGYNLLDSFHVMKSFKIFVRVLRKDNTERGNIIYTETEQKQYEEKLAYISKKKNQFKNSIQNSYIFQEEKPVFSFQNLEMVEEKITLGEKHKELQKRVEDVSLKSAKILADFQSISIAAREQIRDKCNQATDLVAQPWIQDIKKKEWIKQDLEEINKFLDQKQIQLTSLEEIMKQLKPMQPMSKNKRKKQH